MAEQQAVTQFLHDLLACDVDRLPADLLRHKFWFSFPQQFTPLAAYRSCMISAKLFSPTCQTQIKSHCGGRFAEKPPDRLVECNLLLHNDTYKRSDPDVLVQLLRRRFDNYISCLASARKQVDELCSGILRSLCVDRKLRAMKVVRATMDSIGPLLSAMPNLRVIHLLRDPRAVASSRIRFDASGRGAFTERQMREEGRLKAEAMLYCRHATDDVKSRLSLERQFPGRFYVLTYERFVGNPVFWASDVYRFLNETMPPETSNTLQQMANTFRGNRTSVSVSTAWQEKLANYVAATIGRNCPDLINFIDELNMGHI